MRSWMWLLVMVAGGCAPGSRVAPVPVQGPAAASPAGWEDSPRRAGAEGSRRDPRGYPGTGSSEWRPPTTCDSAGNRPEEGERRVLAGRGTAFMHGVGVGTGVLPLRERTWLADARAVAVASDSVVFVTPWLRQGRDKANAPCGSARLVGVFRVEGGDLVLRGRAEVDGPSWLGGAEAGERVRALMDDMEMYARGAIRGGEPLPSRA